MIIIDLRIDLTLYISSRCLSYIDLVICYVNIRMCLTRFGAIDLVPSIGSKTHCIRKTWERGRIWNQIDVIRDKAMVGLSLVFFPFSLRLEIKLWCVLFNALYRDSF